jgi:hypothetical protein
MRRFAATLTGTGAAVFLVAALPLSEQASSATSRIVDRTFRCTPSILAGGGGLRDLDLVSRPRGAHEFIGWQNPAPSPGYVGVGTGGHNPTAELVAVRADAWERFRNRRVPEGVYASAARCAPTRISVPLSSTGLTGPPVRWSEDTSCPISGRLLVRVRAVLQSTAAWQRIDGTYIGARRTVAEAKLAVRTERSRRPIALLELTKSGQTRLWTSSTCG